MFKHWVLFWLISDFQTRQNKMEIEWGGASKISQIRNGKEKTIYLLSLLVTKFFYGVSDHLF